MSRSRLIAFVTGLVLGVTSLAVVPSTAAQAAYPGTDGKLVFVRNQQIFTGTSTATNIMKLTSAGKNFRPEWSPNGKRIAYLHEAPIGVVNIWVMNADGTNKRQVTTLGDVQNGPTWSPDGTRLALTRTSSRALASVSSTAPYGDPVEFLGYNTGFDDPDSTRDPSVRIPILVATSTERGQIAWSADNRIVYDGPGNANLDFTIRVFNVATHANDTVRTGGGDCCGYPQWRDVFWGPSNTFGYAEQRLDYPYEVYAPSAVQYAGLPLLANGDGQAAPSPSGTRMAVVNYASGKAQIFLQNSNGTGRVLLTQGYHPDWQAAAAN